MYDTVEPNVIDDEMLRNAVEEQGPREEAGHIAKMEGISFKDVTSLRLDFKNILKIDNLWQFHHLTKLQLDNNIIEKIQGLDTLVHLVWLDLSFNNIEVIEGLSALTRLEDLSLHNNRISVLENMDHLKNLQVLSIGNNNLTSLENLIYLRQFQQLRTLNLSGNPLSEDEESKLFVAAHLPDLVYLDFRLIDDNVRDIANVKYQYSIEEMNHNETLERVKREKEEKDQRELDKHKAAYVENLNGPFLFEGMYAEDVEGTRLSSLPAVAELVESYRTKCSEVCQNIFEYGLNHHEKRDAEMAVFNECLQEAVRENQEAGAKKIQEVQSRNYELLYELSSQITDQQILDAKSLQYSQDVAQLMDALLNLEIQLVDQLEEIIKEYERNIGELVSTFLETAQGLMAQVRDLENQHHEKLLELCINMLEQVLKGELDEDMTDELRALFVDKDTIINAVSASHDIHMLKIDNREDELVTKINNWATDLIQKVHQEELRRNRKRVAEINTYVDHLRDELDNLDIHEQI
ncbi:dynein regulatory complex subunit 3 isoform X2 [Bufo gargarizans]|uniref:dynein regulatory complex subunit 3 isoform X2 n=1 Tax=Bufo gargarizans TaxID=30331 RepID=UPI001CF1C38F|nr:dynein regulatory complex subunit 3 isoform X2 [Bufo gargarizans]